MSLQLPTINATKAYELTMEVRRVLEECVNRTGGTADKTYAAAVPAEVLFLDIFVLYKRLPGEKRIYLPGELDFNECITIQWNPRPGCTIVIDSVPACRVWRHTFKTPILN